MTLTIEFEGHSFTFTLDMEEGTWQCDDPAVTEIDEGDFPLIGTAEGKRYEIYSDGTFDEVDV